MVTAILNLARALASRGFLIGFDLITIALFMPAFMVMSSWGSRYIGPIPIYIICLLTGLAFVIFYVARFGVGISTPVFLVGVVMVALAGTNDVMYWLGPIVGGAYIVASGILMGSLVGSGVYLGHGIVATVSVETSKDTWENTKNAFHTFAVFAFIAAAVSMSTMIAAPVLPYRFTLMGLALMIPLTAGGLAKVGTETAFEVLYTLAHIALSVLIIVCFLVGLQILEPKDIGTQIGKFLWVATNLETYGLPWGIAFVIALYLKRSINNWTNIRAASWIDFLCSVFFLSLAASLLVWLFHPDPGRQALARIWRYFLPNIGFPVRMPVAYTVDQALVPPLAFTTVLLLLYKAIRGKKSGISWGGVIWILIVIWAAPYGFKSLWDRLG